MSDEYWVLDKQDERYYVDLKDPDGHWEAHVKWDGCIDLREFANTPNSPGRTPDPCDTYIHICNLDDFIMRLLALKLAAKTHLGSDWAS